MQNTTKNHSSPLSQINLFCEENDDKTWVVKDFDDDPLTNFTYTTKYCNVITSKVSEFEEDEYIKLLLQREINSSFIQRHDENNAAYIRNSSRNHAINYILHVSNLL